MSGLVKGLGVVWGAGESWILHIDAGQTPPVVTVADDARVLVEGDKYWAWRDGQSKSLLRGGELVHRESKQWWHIADLLRTALPAGDPRWASRAEWEAYAKYRAVVSSD